MFMLAFGENSRVFFFCYGKISRTPLRFRGFRMLTNEILGRLENEDQQKNRNQDRR